MPAQCPKIVFKFLILLPKDNALLKHISERNHFFLDANISDTESRKDFGTVESEVRGAI